MPSDSPALLGAPCPGEWRHRGCIVRMNMAHPDRSGPFAVRHASGLPMGQATSLREARQLIDEGILLVRQRLVATT